MACLVAFAAACGDSRQTASGDTKATARDVCDVHAEIDREGPTVTADDTNEQVAASLERTTDDDRALADAATAEMRERARRVLDNGERYRERYLAERRDAGSGRELTALAASEGFGNSRQYVESLVFEDPTTVERDRRTLSALLAAECDHLTPPDPGRLDPDRAPAGEILAAELGSAEIRRFSTSGEDLGALDLPAEVEPPIRFTTLSPDGRRLAFLAGTEPALLWVLDLASDAATSTTAPGCMDWDVEGDGLWALVGAAPDHFVTRIGTDGSVDAGSRLDVADCPYRLDSTSLAVPRSPIDGAPLRIDRVPTDGGPPEPLTDSPCNLANPRVSPDGERLLLTAGCRTDASSGAYVVGADGENLRQLFSGIAASATWSPDGGWFAFGAYDPANPGDDETLRVVISSTGGDTLGVVTPPGYSWPIWVAAWQGSGT